MSIIDTSTEFGQRVQRRLQNEPVIWLTTQGKNGTPQPSPVWFLRSGEKEVLIYSKPDAPKMRNIAARPAVALSFNSTASGGDVVVFNGEAAHDPDAPSVADNPEYIEKYKQGIAGLNLTPKQFAAEYSAPIRVKLTKLRGF